MAVWMPVGDEFIEADVIRWKEPVFRNRRRGQPAKVGDRVVTAEVLSDGGRNGWVDLLVRGSEAVSANLGWNLSDVWLPTTGNETRRRRRTLLKGNPERLAWSDEGARDIVASELRVRRNPAPPPPVRKDETFPLRASFNLVAQLSRNRPRKPAWEPPRPRF